MALPPFVCFQLSLANGELRITLPGGAVISPQSGVELGDNLAVARSLIAQVNAALTPLVPIFNVIDVVKLIFDALGAVTNPFRLAEILAELAQKIDALLQLLPQYSVPLLVRQLIDVLIVTLRGLQDELRAIIAQQARIAAAATVAAQPGNVALQAVVDCANGKLEKQLANLNASMAPLNRLIGLVNLLLGLAGLPELPTFTELGEDAEAALGALDVAINALETAQAALPG